MRVKNFVQDIHVFLIHNLFVKALDDSLVGLLQQGLCGSSGCGFSFWQPLIGWQALSNSVSNRNRLEIRTIVFITVILLLNINYLMYFADCLWHGDPACGYVGDGSTHARTRR